MSQPRNVTPGYEDNPNRFPPGAFGDDAAPEWFGWSWPASRDRAFPWLGLLLVIIGAGLLLEYFVPAIGATTLFLAAISAAFFAGFFSGRSYVALIPALLIGALVVARLVEELGIYTGSGTTALAVAGAFLIIWLIGASRGPDKHGQRHWAWAMWPAAIFGLIGLVELAGRLGGIPSLGALWPAAILVIGLLIVFGGRRNSVRR